MIFQYQTSSCSSSVTNIYKVLKVLGGVDFTKYIISIIIYKHIKVKSHYGYEDLTKAIIVMYQKPQMFIEGRKDGKMEGRT